MRICFCADIHIGAPNTDLSELMGCFEQMISSNDLIVIGGDILDSKFYASSDNITILMDLFEYITALIKPQKKILRLIYGTQSHDSFPQLQILEPFAHMMNFKIIPHVTVENINGVSILYIPEEIISNKREYYADTLYSGKKYDYIFGHGVIAEGMPMVKEGKVKKMASVPVFKTEELIQACKYQVCFGHMHCLPLSTEVLTDEGYKPLSSISLHDNVACYDKNTKKIVFHNPTNIICRPMYSSDIMYEYSSTKLRNEGVPQVRIRMTSHHRNLYQDEVMETKDLPDELLFQDLCPLPKGVDESFIKNKYSDDMIRLITWIVGDFTFEKTHYFVKNQEKTCIRIRAHFRKERKIKIVDELLTKMHINHSVHVGSDGTTRINIIGDANIDILKLLRYQKTFPPDFIYMNRHQAGVFIETLIQVDGDWENFMKYKSWRYNTTKINERDLVATVLSINGIYSRSRTWKPPYYPDRFSDRSYVDIININPTLKRKQIPWEDAVGCIEVPTGFFICRQEGISFITGNCRWEHKNVSYVGSLTRFKNGESEPKGWYCMEGHNIWFVNNQWAPEYTEYNLTAEKYGIDEFRNFISTKLDEFHLNSNHRDHIKFTIYLDKSKPNALSYLEIVRTLCRGEGVSYAVKDTNDTILKDDIITNEYDYILDQSVPIKDKIVRYNGSNFDEDIDTDLLDQYISKIKISD